MPSGTMMPVSSAALMKLRGLDQAALGMVPAHQRLEAVDGRAASA